MHLPRLVRFAGLELAVWASVYGAYLAVRGLTIGAPAEAMRHARDVVSIERTLGIFPAVSPMRPGAVSRRLAPWIFRPRRRSWTR